MPAWAGVNVRYGLGIMETPNPCGTLWGNGGDIAGYSHVTQNSADGTRQGTIIVGLNPMSDELGEAKGQALQAMMTAALGRSC